MNNYPNVIGFIVSFRVNIGCARKSNFVIFHPYFNSTLSGIKIKYNFVIMENKGIYSVLVIGAGKSVSGVLHYFSDCLDEFPVELCLVDEDIETARAKAQSYSFISVGQLDVLDNDAVLKQIAPYDVVISMVPAFLHIHLAKACLALSKNLFTASYVSEEMQSLEGEVIDKGLLFLMECGLDPGIDHMSAQREIDLIHEKNGFLKSFKSFTGGLVAPESDNNPWNYKFTWNPINVVLAGTGVVKFIKHGLYKYIPYHEVFQRLEEIEIQEMGVFEAYPNRDSLKYRHIYGVDQIPTILRGTLRRPGFCEAWNILVQLGMTDNSYKLLISKSYTQRDFTNSFLAYHSHYSVEDKLCMYFGLNQRETIYRKLEWLGLFETDVLPEGYYSPADILLKILEKKWGLDDDDKDMVVMQHQFEYDVNGESQKLKSSMVSLGKNAQQTSMSETVGLPLAMSVRLFLEGKVDLKGVCRPTHKSLYVPILDWLKAYGIVFKNETV